MLVHKATSSTDRRRNRRAPPLNRDTHQDSRRKQDRECGRAHARTTQDRSAHYGRRSPRDT